MIDILLGAIDRLSKLKSLRDAKGQLAFTEVFKPTFGDLEKVHGNYLELYDEVERRLPDFSFLERPGAHWLSRHNYVNFFSEADGQAFLAAEGRAGDKLHVTLCPRGFLVDYPVPGDNAPIPIIFRERRNAEQAARKIGAGDVRPMPDPDIPPDVVITMRELIDHIRTKRLEFAPVRARLRSLVQVMKDVPLGTEGDLFIGAVLDYFPDGSWEPYRNLAVQNDELDTRKPFSTGATSMLEVLKSIEAPGALANAEVLNTARSDAQSLLFALKKHQQRHWERVSAAFAQLQAKRLRMW